MPDNGTPSIPRMDWLDYLRLVAALWIMLAHYMLLAPDPRIGHGITDFGWGSRIAPFGALGIVAFMMISGLVITLVAQREPASTFISHRIARIYPTFFFCMTFTAMVSPLGPRNFYDSWPQYFANLLINAPALGYRYVDTVYWTLVIEIYFYAAMALVILVGAVGQLQAIVVAWIVIQVFGCISRINVPLIGHDYYFTSAGAVLALIYQRRNERGDLILLAVSLGLCLSAVHTYARAWGFDYLVGGFITVCIFGLFLLMRGHQFRLPFSQRIGSMTYPLFLLHFSLGMTILYWWINESNKWLLVFGVAVSFVVLAFIIDDLIEFRLRPLWRRVATATVGRPFSWWENGVTQPPAGGR